MVNGDTMGFWKFFRSTGNWGRLPLIGIGSVIASNHGEVKVGEKRWGYFPASSHLKVKAGNVRPQYFMDMTEGRDVVARDLPAGKCAARRRQRHRQPAPVGLYGDGVFDMTPTFGGEIFKLREHVERLYRSLKALRIDAGLDPEEMAAVS